MHKVLALIILGLMARQVFRIPDPFIMRTVFLGIGLITAIFYLIKGVNLSISKYISLLIFIFWSYISFIFSPSYIYSGYQSFTLSALIFFLIVFNSNHDNLIKGNYFIEYYLTLSCLLIVLVSLLLMFYYPSFAIFYDDISNIKRLRGVFTNPEGMSYVSGFIIGMIIFSAHHKNNIFIKLFFLIITLIAFFLSGSRTYWAACFFSTVIVIIKLNPFKNIKANLSYLTTGIVILCLILTAAFFIKPDPIVNNIIKYFRLESLENLSGRIYVWQIAFEKVYERPLLGYGLGSGDEAFKEKESIRFGNKPSEDMYLKRQRSSLHNGFVQALLDVGIPGFLFYTITIIIANIRMLKSNKKENAAALFGILYFSIINFGQSSILGAATFQGILAWYFIVYGLSQSN